MEGLNKTSITPKEKAYNEAKKKFENSDSYKSAVERINILKSLDTQDAKSEISEIESYLRDTYEDILDDNNKNFD